MSTYTTCVMEINAKLFLLTLSSNEPHDKTNKMSVHPAKTKISLGIRPVWSESSLCTQWVAKDPSFLHADSKDSDQTGQMPRLIWVFTGHTLTLLVLSCRGSNTHLTCFSVFTELFWAPKSNPKGADFRWFSAYKFASFGNWMSDWWGFKVPLTTTTRPWRWDFSLLSHPKDLRNGRSNQRGSDPCTARPTGYLLRHGHYPGFLTQVRCLTEVATMTCFAVY